MHTRSVGYLELIKGNRNFRRLWFGDIISLLGDWFNTIALYALVEELSGSPMALGWVFMIKMGALGLASPLAGVLADRYDRRRLMIGADLLRAFVVLGFLLVDSQEDLWLLYTLIAVQIALGSVFDPARSASLPNITSGQELLTANALMASTWSTLLAFGAALGGFAAGWFGIAPVFWIDAATYLVSALCILGTQIPSPAPVAPDAPPLWTVAWSKIVDGWGYLWKHPEVGRMALAKASWASGGAALVYMLAMLGPELPVESEAIGIGLLFSARGLGTGIGPLLGRALVRDRRRWPWVIGVCLVGSGIVYGTTWLMPWTLWITIPILVAHAASGANWVFSSVLLQERAEDVYRGRVFATEWMMLTGMNVVSVMAASVALERGLLSLRDGMLAACGVIVLAGVVWLVLVVPAERRAVASSPP